MEEIPITLQPVTVAVGVRAANINELIALVAKNLIAFVKANVSFFLQVTVDPTAYQVQLIYNSTQNVFKGWNVGSGRYLPITQFQPGDVKNTFVSGDVPQQGWIILDGRAISAIQGISQYQSAVLQTLFGANGSLPTVKPFQNIAGMPANGSFSGIENPAVTPAQNQFANIAVGSPPSQTDVQNVTANCETLDQSTAAVQKALAQTIAQSELVINSLNGAGPTLYSAVFAGFP